MLKVSIYVIICLCTSSSWNCTQMLQCAIPGYGSKTFKCTCALSPWPTESWCIYT